MRSDFLVFTVILLVSVLLIDLYTYRGLQVLIEGVTNSYIRYAVNIVYWATTALIMAGVIWVGMNGDQMRNPRFFTSYVMPLFGAVMLLVFPKIVFILFQAVEDLGRFSFYVYSKVSTGDDQVAAIGELISRRAFLTQAGAALAVVPFVSIAYGIFKGKYNFRILEEQLRFENLPASFDGLRIAHISDLHIGSFGDNYEAVKKGIDMVNTLEPDVILFTGDLVNNYAEETDGWLPYLGLLRAKKAKYSILGNHDYGDYAQWDSAEEKQKNLQKVIDFHEKMGFKILLNEHAKLQEGDEHISIIGVENWGRDPFPKYGDLQKAMNGSDTSAFKILLSHDPSHWDEEVLKKTNIDVTFSGHTHGMQFGVEIGNIKWSPVKFKYPRWGGLYTEGNQHLYVNRGFGFIGFPGRVGMPPEITFIELKKA